MRELTEYEKKKWFDGHYFEMDASEVFLGRGDELDRAFNCVLSCTDQADMTSDEFELAARIQALDMYYYQIHYYTGAYGGYVEPEELNAEYGLPPVDIFWKQAESMDIEEIDEDINDRERELWDWAMEWRRTNFDRTRAEARIRNLKEELDREIKYLVEVIR